jgi:hypothetical protein
MKMSSGGELYVNETCRDEFADELDKLFGKDEWNLDASGFSDFWDMEQLPETITAPITNNDRKVIGEALITSEFSIVDGGYGRYIEANPTKIKITDKR